MKIIFYCLPNDNVNECVKINTKFHGWIDQLIAIKFNID